MMLMNCNVSRIGGSGPLPQPLTVIQDGCPVVGQVVGPVERSQTGLFTPLTAFRIDGSAEIQIVCMVMFCPQQCQPVSRPLSLPSRSSDQCGGAAQVICPRGDGTSVASLGRRKREVEMELAEDEEAVVESVNGRLRVFVEGEEGAPGPPPSPSSLPRSLASLQQSRWRLQDRRVRWRRLEARAAIRTGSPALRSRRSWR